MSATRMPTGRWRVTLGHHHRVFLYFDTWEEASEALREQQWTAMLHDYQKAKNQKAKTEKTEKPKTEKAKTEKPKSQK